MQVTYRFKSEDDREISLRADFTRDDSVLVSAPPEYNSEYFDQPLADQKDLVKGGIETTEAILTQYAKDYGYSLNRMEGTNSVSLNVAPPTPVDFVASGDEPNILLEFIIQGDYVVERSVGSLNSFVPMSALDVTDDTSVSDTDIIEATHSYRCRRVIAGAKSAWSKVSSYTPDWF